VRDLTIHRSDSGTTHKEGVDEVAKIKGGINEEKMLMKCLYTRLGERENLSSHKGRGQTGGIEKARKGIGMYKGWFNK